MTARVADLLGPPAPEGDADANDGIEVVVDIDATLITAQSDKQDAAPTRSVGSGSTR